MERKNKYCTENQLIELENKAPEKDNRITLYILYTILILLGLSGLIIIISAVINIDIPNKDLIKHVTFKPAEDLIKHVTFKPADYIIHGSLYAIIFIYAITVIVLVATSKYDIINYTSIIDSLKTAFSCNNYIRQPSENTTYFTNLDPDLKRSIINKYTAYKEEKNKETIYTRADIEEELKAKLNQPTAEKFAKELINYLNIPYDIKLIKEGYERASCTPSLSFPSILRTVDGKEVWTNMDARLPRTTPLILTWVLIVLLLYYFIHPLYQENKLYLAGTVILIIFIILLVYLLGERNNV